MLCPCGSNKKLRDCHLDEVISLREQLGADTILGLQSQLQNLMKAERET